MSEETQRGRPTKYTPEIAEKICELLSEGVTMKTICAMEGMPTYKTIYNWEAAYPDFLHLSMRAREAGTNVLADQCIEIADDPVLDPNDKRIRIDTRMRLIGKWNAKRYGDKIEHEVNHGFIPLDKLEAEIKKIELAQGALPPVKTEE